MTTARAILATALIALAAAAAPATADAQRTSDFRTLINRVGLPPITDGDRYVVLGDRGASVFAVHDTVTKGTRALAKPPGCGWGAVPRTAHFGRIVLSCPTGPQLMSLRTGAAQPLPPAAGYAVGRRWLAGMDAQSLFYLDPRTNELRRSTGPRDIDHRSLRRVCGRLRRGGGSLPDSDDLAYDATRYLAMTARGFYLRPCNRRRKAVRLQAGSFAGFELPDDASLSAGFVTWLTIGADDLVRGYDARRKRRWEWVVDEDAIPMHTRNALVIADPREFLDICGTFECEVDAWRAEIAPISRAKPRRSARRQARRPAGRGRRS